MTGRGWPGRVLAFGLGALAIQAAVIIVDAWLRHRLPPAATRR